MTSEERRLHPAAVGAEALDQLRGLLVPILIAAVLGGRDAPGRALLFGVAGAALAVLVAFARWESARWWVADGAVHLRRGVFTRTETTIAFERIQAIDTVRGPVQRLFGVVALHVQAAGGGREGELVLQAVTVEDAEALRTAARMTGVRPHASAGGPAWSLGMRRLVVAALTSGSLAVLVPVLAAAAQMSDDVLGEDEAGRLIPHSAGAAALLVGGVLLVAWALSIAGTIAAFAGFAVRRDGERLLIRRGIVERRDQSVPVARVHAVTIVEGLLREPFGLAAVRLETAGYGTEAATTRTLVPLARRGEIPRILETLLPELGGAAAHDLSRPPRRAARRFVLPPLLLGAVPAAVVLAVVGDAVALLVLVLPLAGALVGFLRWSAAGWRLSGDRVVMRSRRLARMTLLADARRVQLVRSSQSPFQRRANLASVGVGVSSGRSAGVAHLDGEVVDDLVTRLGALAR